MRRAVAHSEREIRHRLLAVVVREQADSAV